MFTNYLTVAYRSLLRNKVFSIINVLGLAVGITACLFILQYVRFEKSFDAFHKHGDDIYRVTMDRYVGGESRIVTRRTHTHTNNSHSVVTAISSGYVTPLTDCR